MIRGPVVFRMLDGGRVESTSPDPRDVPFGAKGTELWFFDSQGDHYGTIVSPDNVSRLFPTPDSTMEPS